MPRLGIGMPLVSTPTGAPVLAVQDFFWLNDISGELTPIHTASRTNLITYSEELNSTSNVTSSNTTSPDGTLSGLKLNETTSNSQHYGTSHQASVVSGTMYTVSFYIKKGTYDLVKVYTQSSLISASINITFSTESTNASGSDLVISSDFMEDVGNGWYRVGFSATASSTGAVSIYLPPKDLTTYVGDVSQYTEYWGVQLEQDSRVSAYIPTSGSTVTVATPLNDTHNTWDYDSANLTLEEDPDSEGSWQRPSNVVLNHDFADLGSEIIPDGDFTNQAAADYWQINNSRATISLETGFMRLTYDSTVAQALYKNSILTSGKSYKVTFRAKGTANNKFGSIGDNNSIQDNAQYAVSNPNLTTNWQDYEFYVPVTSTLLRLYLTGSIQVGQTLDITNISVKQVDPNDRWTLSSEWSISDGKLKGLGSGAYGIVAQAISGITSEKLKLTFEISDYVTGTFRISPDHRADGLDIRYSGNGTYEVYYEAAHETFKFQMQEFEGSIDNVTVKEYAAMPLDV